MGETRWRGKDVILLLLYAPGQTGKKAESVSGRTRIMKLVFLFEEEIYPEFKFDHLFARDDLSEFMAWDFGPFSKDVLNDLEFFTRIGFVRSALDSDETPTVEEAREYEYWAESDDSADEVGAQDFAVVDYSLSDLGVRYVEERLWPALTDAQKKVLSDYKRKFNSTSLFALLEYVYKKYPDQITESKIRERVLGPGATL